ncbi:MAG: ABC transporter ATP-binding protein [Candidatus Hydrogenedentes bacterium]|nr:ABC transporter ATP-binding protein [Candidatus Hydrogenedentota bacterium]
MPGGAVIRISNLHVVYKSARGKPIEAVSGLDLQVDEGEVVGVVGPNGAGKTTTIKALMGFLFPSEGKAEVFGLEAGSVDARRRTGFLPEVAVYYPFLTARETLGAYAALQEIPKSERAAVISRLIEKVGLAGREREPLRRFSKGMLQRVGLAQAIMGDPDLLILDEVTSGLDPVARRDVREILLEFKARGKTVFFSSHELSEVTMVCDRVVLLDEGKVVEERALADLLRSARRLVTVARGAPDALALPEGVRLRSAEGGRVTLVADSEPAHEALRRQLETAGLAVVDTFQETGSLEDYFVDAIGHKVT